MRILIRLFIICLAVFMLTCKKKQDIEPSSVHHFVLKDSKEQRMILELNWTVDGHDDGEKYVNLDLYLADTTHTGSVYSAPAYAYSIKTNSQPEILQNAFQYFSANNQTKRAYLGIAANGITPLGLSLNKELKIKWSIKAYTNEQAEYLTGEFILQPVHAQKTVVHNIYTVDVVEVNSFNITYSFRSLTQTVVVVREPDITEINTFTGISTPGYARGFSASLEWEVNDRPNGYNDANLDLYIVGYPSSHKEGRSVYNDKFESVLYTGSLVGNYDFLVGLVFKSLSTVPISGNVNYTITISSITNPFNRFIYKGAIATSMKDPDKIYCDIIIHNSLLLQNNYDWKFEVEALSNPLVYEIVQ